MFRACLSICEFLSCFCDALSKSGLMDFLTTDPSPPRTFFKNCINSGAVLGSTLPQSVLLNAHCLSSSETSENFAGFPSFFVISLYRLVSSSDNPDLGEYFPSTCPETRALKAGEFAFCAAPSLCGIFSRLTSICSLQKTFVFAL